MKSEISRAAVILGAMLLGAGTAGAAISDHSFESGPPPASAWAEVSNNLPQCEGIGDFRVKWSGLAAADGTLDFWGGGSCFYQDGYLIGTENQVSQTITLGPDDNTLIFKYAAMRVSEADPAGDDVAYVKINGIAVWTLDVSTAATSTWSPFTRVGGFVEASANLSPWAGQTVVIELGYESAGFGLGVGNVRFDALSVTYTDQEPSPLIFASNFDQGDLGGWLTD